MIIMSQRIYTNIEYPVFLVVHASILGLPIGYVGVY
jgi:hypothetical protein